MFRLADCGTLEKTRSFPPIETLTKLEAWSLSVEKWQQIVKELKSGHMIQYDGGIHTCALCYKYNVPLMRSASDALVCNGCPVKAKTGFSSCVATPYYDFEDNPTLENAKAELEFLLSLAADLLIQKTIEGGVEHELNDIES